MTDNRSWPWKKKSSEKIIVAADMLEPPSKGKQGERHLTDKAEPADDQKISNDRLSLTLSEYSSKDDTVRKHAKMAQEAVAGCEKAEAEALYMKQKLDEVLKEKVAGEERLTHLEAALKECKQQLHFVRGEQEQRIHDAMMKTSREFENERIFLEAKVTETNKRVLKLGAENTLINKALLAKEKLINDLNQCMTQKEADFNALMTRLQSTEKENATLKYEVRVLEKELEIRNEEIEFNRRTADVTHKQHLENVKKVAKLESECQRLRLLVRKRLPGPAALAKMKNEVELLGRDPPETRMRKSNASPTRSLDFVVDNDLDYSNKRINFLTEQLLAVDEENRTLKESLYKKTNELHLSRNMYAQFDESSKGNSSAERTRNLPRAQELSLASMSDIGSDDKVSCAESWASESEHFIHGTSKTVGASEMNLMDDFVEMEKLAVVSGHEIVSPLETKSSGSFSVGSSQDNILAEKFPRWLHNILKVILEHSRLAQRNPDAVLNDVKVALTCIYNQNADEFVDDLSLGNSSNLSKSICKIIELVEGAGLPSQSLETSVFTVRVFQWKTSELGSILLQFVQTCNDLLNGKANLESFARELTSALDWVMNHCFSLQDVSSMRETIKKQFDWDETPSESDIEGGTSNQFLEARKLHNPREQLLFHMEELQLHAEEDFKRLKTELANVEGRINAETNKSESLMIRLQESEKTILGLQVELETLKQSKRTIEKQVDDHKLVNEDLDKQLMSTTLELNEARRKFSCLETELESKNKSCKELEATCLDLKLQLESVTKKENPTCNTDQEDKQLRTDLEITAASEKLAECQETILHLGKQLKAMASPNNAAIIERFISSPANNNTTIITTSSSPSSKTNNPRSTLLEKMLADDKAKVVAQKSVDTKHGVIINTCKSPNYRFSNLNDQDQTTGNSLAVVPSKKKGGGGGFLKKLFSRRKKGNNGKKSPLLPVAAA